MAQSESEQIAARVRKGAEFRLHHAGTKLNERELGELEALRAKRGQTQGEFGKIDLGPDPGGDLARPAGRESQLGVGGDHGGSAAAGQPVASGGSDSHWLGGLLPARSIFLSGRSHCPGHGRKQSRRGLLRHRRWGRLSGRCACQRLHCPPAGSLWLARCLRGSRGCDGAVRIGGRIFVLPSAGTTTK